MSQCIECSGFVRPRQHGVSCDNCEEWQHRTCNTDHEACVDLREVIGVKAAQIPPKPSPICLRNSRKVEYVAIEMQDMRQVGFAVYVATRTCSLKWRYRQLLFQCKDHQLCQQWITSIKEALRSPAFSRPQKLIAFVNPFSGKKKGVQLYHEKVEPLLELADIQIHLIKTERANHARDLIEQTLNLQDIGGLVCVGGDGMFSEILNGLLTRSLLDDKLPLDGTHVPRCPDLRIGIIPAGSTNTIIYSTTGICDIVTSTLHIILGASLGVDVNSVNVNKEHVIYGCTMLGYGYFGDLLKDSETKRWMGPKRYDWSGTKTFMANKAYHGEVKFRPSPNTDSHPTDQEKCYSGCETCFRAGDDDASKDDRLLVPDNCDAIEKDEACWQTVKGTFVAVNAATMSCQCNLTPSGVSPFCHLGDGCMDLILVSKCSRFDFLRFLLRTAKGKQISNLHFIQTHRVKEFSFHLMANDTDDADTTKNKKRLRERLKSKSVKTSVWNCDGEVIPSPNIKVKAHCQLVKLFARGIEDTTSLTNGNCQLCCSSSSDTTMSTVIGIETAD